MKVVKRAGNEDIAMVYVGESENKHIEFAESVQKPFKREDKWVIIISCLSGCPVKCLMCDAGQHYNGRLGKEEIFSQIDYMITKRFPDRKIPVKKFKVQFTRMGEPAFNPAVLEVLEEIPQRYDAPCLIPSLSTIGPHHCEQFFERLIEIKNILYNQGRFQLQFSIHTTDTEKRDMLIPISKMSFSEIAEYGKKFYEEGDRKITLNFIVMDNFPIDPGIIRSFFDPAMFIIKLTPLNPTKNARKNKLETKSDLMNEKIMTALAKKFQAFGFETIVSIGNSEENEIGSNCGQYISVQEKK